MFSMHGWVTNGPKYEMFSMHGWVTNGPKYEMFSMHGWVTNGPKYEMFSMHGWVTNGPKYEMFSMHGWVTNVLTQAFVELRDEVPPERECVLQSELRLVSHEQELRKCVDLCDC